MVGKARIADGGEVRGGIIPPEVVALYQQTHVDEAGMPAKMPVYPSDDG